jgi:hypothetical protein
MFSIAEEKYFYLQVNNGSAVCGKPGLVFPILVFVNQCLETVNIFRLDF